MLNTKRGPEFPTLALTPLRLDRRYCRWLDRRRSTIPWLQRRTMSWLDRHTLNSSDRTGTDTRNLSASMDCFHTGQPECRCRLDRGKVELDRYARDHSTSPLSSSPFH